MNIVKLQNELKGVPDDALIGYVQNPTGQVPTYLALSELQRRKEMRNNYQAAKPEKTVAQGLVDQAQPQPMQQGIAAVAPPQPAPMPQAPVEPPQGMADGGEVHYADGGIAGLDTGNMYDEQIYAQGGIVAFADGGDTGVQHYAEGGTSKIGDFFRGLGNPAALDIDKQIGALQAEKNKIKMDIFGSYTPEQRAAQQQRLAAIDAQVSTLSSQRNGSSNALNAPSTPPGANVMGSEASAALPTQNPLSSLATPNAVPGMIKSAADTTTGAKPAADVTKPTVEQDPFAALKKTLAVGPTEKPKSIQDYAGEYKKALGDDPTVQGAKDRLAKMESKAAADESKSGWMALAKAGLAMASGTSPRALQNIATGATAGVNDYTEAQDRLEKLREKHFELQSQLDRQARAEQISAVTYGANSKEHAEDRVAREKLQKMAEGNQLAIAQLNYGLNVSNKAVANRDKAIDNAMAKTKAVLGDSGADPAEFDKLYNTYLQQELSTLGVTGATGATYKPPVSGTLQPAKNGILNYVRNALK